MEYHSNNPALKKLQKEAFDGVEEDRATYKGVAGKSLFFIGMTFAGAIAGAAILFNAPPMAALIVMIVAIIGTFICAILSSFLPKTIKVTGTLYAVFEGIMVGAISAVVGLEYGGVVLAALLCTFGVFAVMMFMYYRGIIKVSSKFKSGMIAALFGLVLVHLTLFIVGLFVPSILQLFYYGNSWISIIVSVIMVVFASFFILVDLDDITMIVESGMPKQYEWRAAFSLTLTLIWLYLEFLRLFLKIASRKK